MPAQENEIIIFIIATSSLIFMLAGFIISIVFLYQKKQIVFQENIEEIKLSHEKNLLQAQLEVQEQTFMDVSRDIHDNISLSLTLSKLHLNTIKDSHPFFLQEKIDLSVGLISEAIHNLRNISKSLNSDIIKNHGLLRAVENEVDALSKTGLYKIDYDIIGSPFFIDSKKELILFRIVQEAFNNIIKHAHAKKINLILQYHRSSFSLHIEDNGIGFLPAIAKEHCLTRVTAGLNNMHQRARMLDGEIVIDSVINQGTTIKISIPL